MECGNFLEIHRVGSSEVLSYTRIRGQYGSGYRTTTIKLTRKGDESQLLCAGSYEIWWVKRSLTSPRPAVELKKRFQISSPPCDWDADVQNFKEISSGEKISLYIRELTNTTDDRGKMGLAGKGDVFSVEVRFSIHRCLSHYV